MVLRLGVVQVGKSLGKSSSMLKSCICQARYRTFSSRFPSIWARQQGAASAREGGSGLRASISTGLPIKLVIKLINLAISIGLKQTKSGGSRPRFHEGGTNGFRRAPLRKAHMTCSHESSWVHAGIAVV